MRLSEFDYYIPKNQIAQYPPAKRDSSRLLVLHKRLNKLEHRFFRDIVEYLLPGDVLVLNNTKVVPVRLYGVRPSGSKTEIVLLKELRKNIWEALVKGPHRGKVMLKQGISALISPSNGVARVRFEGVVDIKESLNEIGVMALPPYIRREATRIDKKRYQTIYAEKEGAIAAPTAGLHFTGKLIDIIEKKGIEVKTLTLHVGYGTFKPVRTSDIKRHQMDEEYYDIPKTTAEAVNRAKSEGRRVIAVGTTVTRALEASAEDTTENRIDAGAGKATIFIYPGYRYKIIDALVTNLHQPKSSPMMLTSAFAGLELLKDAYSACQRAGYRFFSYGDAMLII